MARTRTVVKKLIPKKFFPRIEPTGHLLEAIAISSLYGAPSRGMKVIGVTGTNGKTTTSFMIHRMLVEAGIDAGLMTTVAYGVGNDITSQIAHMTTVSTPTLQKRFAEFRRKRVEWVVLETTSHALAQHRVWGVPYQVAVMTNVTHEHLDYHKTFAAYLDAKRQLFVLANRARNGMRIGVVNADDPNAELFTGAVKHPVTYGVEHGDLQATNVSLDADGSTFNVMVDGLVAYQIHCHIPGLFNVYNSLAAIAVGRALGLTRQQIERGIDALAGVEGRMSVIDEGQAFTVINDFAHTPDSFEKLLRDLRGSVKKRLIVLFGSAGRRDEAKRAIQGEIAGRYADEVILTEEDNRDVDGMTILHQIAGGAESAGKVRDRDLFLVPDRTDAIHFAMRRAGTGDTVVLLGKGHEKTIEQADGEHPWDEDAVARAALQALQTTRHP